jgi:membrane protein
MVAILTASRVVKNFTEGKKAMTLDELSHELDLPVRLVKPIVEDFVETGIFNPVRFDKEEVTRYQPGMSEQQVSICLILEAIDKKGVNEMHTNHQDYIKISDDLLIEFEQTMKDSKTNLLVKDVKL